MTDDRCQVIGDIFFMYQKKNGRDNFFLPQPLVCSGDKNFAKLQKKLFFLMFPPPSKKMREEGKEKKMVGCCITNETQVKKSRIIETLTLLTCADNSSVSKKKYLGAICNTSLLLRLYERTIYK